MKKGFKCKCGEYHEFTPYVFAHWRDEIIYTCPKCGTKYSIIAGTAEEQ